MTTSSFLFAAANADKRLADGADEELQVRAHTIHQGQLWLSFAAGVLKHLLPIDSLTARACLPLLALSCSLPQLSDFMLLANRAIKGATLGADKERQAII